MAVPVPKLDSALKVEFQELFNTCQINDNRKPIIDLIINRILAGKSRYEAVGNPLNIPWYFIALVHNMECSLNFNRHLHNGDLLTQRTVQVPAGRPVSGNPPFTWEASAADSLIYQKLHLKNRKAKAVFT